MDTRDFRIRAFLHIKNEGMARGLHNHILGDYENAVDINSGSPHQEMRQLTLNDTWEVHYDLTFSSELEDIATGLYNHTKNISHTIGYGSIERCGHRIKQPCEIIDNWGQRPLEEV